MVSLFRGIPNYVEISEYIAMQIVNSSAYAKPCLVDRTRQVFGMILRRKKLIDIATLKMLNWDQLCGDLSGTANLGP